MYIVTNRAVHDGKKGFDKFGKTANPKGPLELRVVEVKKRGRGWSVDVLPDKITPEQRDEIGIPRNVKAFASQYVAEKILHRVTTKKRNVLFFIHGFNNDMEAVAERAAKFEELYDVEVVPFSWPANGGGARGVASYKSDKRDATASIGAVDRFLDLARRYLGEFRAKRLAEITAKAEEKFPDNIERQHSFITRAAQDECPFTLNLVLHSMGNYLFKKLLESGSFSADELLFDNVVMVAADANNERHAEWVDRLRVRQRVYITINEDDSALRVSRLKAGEAQRARLGHYIRELHSEQALYIDFTEAPHVGSDHAYFVDKPVENKRGKAHKFFRGAFNGERVESMLDFNDSLGLYRV